MRLNLRVHSLIIVVSLLTLLFGNIQPTMASTGQSRVMGYVDSMSNRTYVPVRYVSELMGASVQWISEDQMIKIERGDSTVQLIIDHNDAIVNGSVVALEAVPLLIDAVTYVPLRFVADTLQIGVEWNKSKASVYVNREDVTYRIPVVALGTNPAKMQPIVNSKKTFNIGKRKYNTNMVKINLLHPSVDLSVGVAGNEIGKVDDLKNLVGTANAMVGINGTFFDAYTEDSFKAAYGYVVKDNEIMNNRGDSRTIIIFDKANNVELIAGEDFRERYKLGDIEGALQAGPRLITDGKVTIDVEGEGFRDPKILTGGGARSAVGITRDHQMILLTVPGATIPQLAEIMLAAGAYQAMNLDGGASSGLYYKGEYLTRTGRQISNALLISVD